MTVTRMTVNGPAVKICGLTRRVDAVDADATGAGYLGAVFARESPRAVTPAHAARLFAGLRARRVGVFVNARTDEMADVAAEARLDVLQLHGEEPPSRVRELRDAGGWELWKAVRVRDAGSFAAALDAHAGHVDGLLLDAWHPGARGGTGRTFDWATAADLRDGFPPGVLLIVAGGLRAENVVDAARALRPHVLDLSSGVESAPGIKDPAAIAAVMRTLRERN